ncbi:MAG: response regulator [Butyrivibrio sp.]|nr:response regulator [Butyrivibrio sp.]
MMTFLITANVFLGIVLVRQSNSALKTHLDDRLLDIAKTAADMIDGDEYEAISGRDENDESYMRIYSTLKYFQDNIELEFIYGVRKLEDNTYIFTVDPAEEDASEYGELVHVTRALETAFEGESAVDSVPYEDSWGRFYSAYTPIFNSKGDVVGVVAVDFSAAYYDQQFKKNILIIVTGIICSIIIGIIIISVYSRKIKNREAMDRVNEQAGKMITAMASDYRSVYFVDIDNDRGICYRAHSKLEDGVKEGEEFKFSEKFTEYANTFVTEEYRQDFLDFIAVDSIRKKLEDRDLVAFRYLTCRDGQHSYEMLRVAGVRRVEDRDDHTVHAIGVGFTDVDEQIREDIEQRKALSEALAIAEEANNAKTVFLSNMSHEIRTPMNAIIGLDSLALSEENVPESVKEYLIKIGSSAQHLLNIINDILDMSRIESGKMVIKNDRFSLKKLFEFIDTMMVSQCGEKGLAYVSKMEENVGEYFFGDDMKLKEILINILGNSVKYTDRGGSITFKVEKIAGYGNKSTLLFTVTDTGIGMDKDFLPRIFDSFAQEDVSAINKYGSTGLGMAITKNLVDMMNGRIEVDSKKGEGSEFRVTLTFENAEGIDFQEGEEKPKENGEDIELKGRNILVAEDMDINAQIIMKILDAKGIRADRAENGKVALEMFEASEEGFYDAILMDMRMPQMTGLEATAAIRALDRTDAKLIPIIALTANAFDEDVERSLQAGLNAHLSKPLSPEDIFRTLKNLIGNYKGR